jgi:hypothetical protein
VRLQGLGQLRSPVISSGIEPETLVPAPTTSRQSNTAAHICSATTARLFITDRFTERQFLADRGSGLCVFIPRRKERVNYDLCAAKSTTIHTYGWLPLSLNLGLHRDCTWRFAVAGLRAGRRAIDFAVVVGDRSGSRCCVPSS